MLAIVEVEVVVDTCQVEGVAVCSTGQDRPRVEVWKSNVSGLVRRHCVGSVSDIRPEDCASRRHCYVVRDKSTSKGSKRVIDWWGIGAVGAISSNSDKCRRSRRYSQARLRCECRRYRSAALARLQLTREAVGRV